MRADQREAAKDSICRITTPFHIVCFSTLRKSFLIYEIFLERFASPGCPFIFAASLPIEIAAIRSCTVHPMLIGTNSPDNAPLRRQARPDSLEQESPGFALPAPEGYESATLEPDHLEIRQWMLGAMVGRSPVMQHLFTRMRCTAPHFRLAAIEGEPGTGKTLAARTLHQLGLGAPGPFSPFAAAEFLEDPLALWREARGGLLYLSHVEELSAVQQRELRDFLERIARERVRIHASSGPLQLVAGSLEPLRRLSATGSFRADLAGHLTAIRFTMPPLRERREDIPLLAALFLRRWSERHGKPLRGFASGALARLSSHSWPGNVRDLESAIAAAALETSSQWIRPIDIPRLDWSAAPAHAVLPPTLASPDDDPNLDRAILRHVTRVLARVNGNKVRAARLLGISRSTLYRMLDAGRSPVSELP
jgi:DNA-binding NtrC family response regulator